VNRRRKYGRAEKPGKVHLFAPLIFLPSFPCAFVKVRVSQTQSKWVKPILWVKLAVGIACKSMTMNSLQNKQLSSGQTVFNLVMHGQNKPIGH
jgi:hypothetical protein